MVNIAVKRVYDKPEAADGVRILVDRLWPRGLAKEKAQVDAWLKSVAPSDDLRKWFKHDPKKWPDFKKRYFAELAKNEEAINELKTYLKKGDVSLLYAAKDQTHNNAVALKAYLIDKGVGDS